MVFAGWNDVSLVDYPSKSSSVAFVSGCNFTCEYCHNKKLWPRLNPNDSSAMSDDDIFNKFKEASLLSDSLVITGGEPTIYGKDLIEFARKFKLDFPLNFLKLDTNGSNPDVIREGKSLFDFISMDLKSMNYGKFSNVDFDTILTSLIWVAKYPKHEVRITVYPPYINEFDFIPIAELLKSVNIKKVALQQFVPQNDLVASYDSKIIKIFASTLISKIGLGISFRGFKTIRDELVYDMVNKKSS